MELPLSCLFLWPACPTLFLTVNLCTWLRFVSLLFSKLCPTGSYHTWAQECPSAESSRMLIQVFGKMSSCMDDLDGICIFFFCIRKVWLIQVQYVNLSKGYTTAELLPRLLSPSYVCRWFLLTSNQYLDLVPVSQRALCFFRCSHELSRLFEFQVNVLAVSSGMMSLANVRNMLNSIIQKVIENIN